MVFVVMDVVVWGLDIFYVCYVYNYDLFNVFDNYVYCIGCIVCVGMDGKVVVFCVLDEIDQLKDI